MTTVEQEPIDAEIVNQLIERPAQLGVLAMAGPAEVLEKAAEVATALAKVITDRRLSVAIKGKNYVMCEGWTTLGAMLGVATREVETIEAAATPGEFVSVVEAIRTSDGLPVGRASASCGPDEKEWGGRSRQARRSMAQTRAAGKAMRLLFSWVMNLAGYAVTPWEEIEGELMPPEHPNPQHDTAAPKAAPRNDRVTASQIDELAKLWKAYVHQGDGGTKEQFATYCREVCKSTAYFEKLTAWTQAEVAVVRDALMKAGPE